MNYDANTRYHIAYFIDRPGKGLSLSTMFCQDLGEAVQRSEELAETMRQEYGDDFKGLNTSTCDGAIINQLEFRDGRLICKMDELLRSRKEETMARQAERESGWTMQP